MKAGGVLSTTSLLEPHPASAVATTAPNAPNAPIAVDEYLSFKMCPLGVWCAVAYRARRNAGCVRRGLAQARDASLQCPAFLIESACFMPVQYTRAAVRVEVAQGVKKRRRYRPKRDVKDRHLLAERGGASGRDRPDRPHSTTARDQFESHKKLSGDISSVDFMPIPSPGGASSSINGQACPAVTLIHHRSTAVCCAIKQVPRRLSWPTLRVVSATRPGR